MWHRELSCVTLSVLDFLMFPGFGSILSKRSQFFREE